jgi:hypothetical protein
LAEIDTAAPAVGERHPLPDRLRKVAPCEIAAHELDVDEPRAFERLAGLTRANDTRADTLTVVENERVGFRHVQERSGRPMRTSTPGE